MTRLEELVDVARADVARRRERTPAEALRADLGTLGGGRPFNEALVRPGLSLIAEFKRRSPSSGDIAEGAGVAEVLPAYERGGAAAVSILTDERNFGGSLEDLRAGRAACSLPILRMDFIVDPYQLLEAAVAGADAVLLIAAALPGDELRRLREEAWALDLDCVIEVQPSAAGPAGFRHPHVQFLCRPFQGRAHVGHRPEMAEQQPLGSQRAEQPQRIQGQRQVEVRWRARRAQVAGLREEHPRGVADVQVAAGRVDQPDVMLGMTWRVMAVQRTAAAEVDRSPLLHAPDALRRSRCQFAEQPVQVVAVDHPGAGHQAARVRQVTRAGLVDHDLRRGVHLGDVAHAAGMVQVDVGDHHRGQVAGPHAERGERVPHHRRRRCRSGLHQARTVGEDQVSGGNLAVSRHPGVDLEHVVPERGDPGVAVPAEIGLVHVGIVPEVPAASAGGWVKHLRRSHADSYILSTICAQRAGRRGFGAPGRAGAPDSHRTGMEGQL